MLLSTPNTPPGLIVQGAWWGVVLNPFRVDAQVVQKFQILKGARSKATKAGLKLVA